MASSSRSKRLRRPTHKRIRQAEYQESKEKRGNIPGAGIGEFYPERPGGGLVLEPLTSHEEQRVAFADAACGERSPVVDKLSILDAAVAKKYALIGRQNA
jgi:hypothetical protein